MNIAFYFFIPFLVGIIAVKLLMWLSKKTGFLVDRPEGDALKIHIKSVPLLGGLAMLIASVAAAAVLFVQIPDTRIIWFFAALLMVFILGFYDDLRWKHISTIKPLLKFALLLICTFIPALILHYAGVDFLFLPIPIISILVSFIYIFVCINAVNYQDGMDGLAGGLTLISLAGFLYLAVTFNAILAAAIALIFLGAVAAFLCFNVPSAKIFMGDSGAYALGFILATAAILFSKPYNLYSVLAPIFIIGLPIFDGVFTNIRRLANGKSIFLGDRSHFYDKLLQKGFSTKKTLTICCGLQLLFVAVGLLIFH